MIDDDLFETPAQLRAYIDGLTEDQLEAVLICSRSVRYWSDETVADGAGDNHADIIYLHADGSADQRMFAAERAKKRRVPGCDLCGDGAVDQGLCPVCEEGIDE